MKLLSNFFSSLLIFLLTTFSASAQCTIEFAQSDISCFGLSDGSLSAHINNNQFTSSAGRTARSFAASSGNYFDYRNGHRFNIVGDTVQIDSVTVYPQGTGNIQINIRNAADAVIYSSPQTSVAGASNQATKVAVGVKLAPGSNYVMDAEGTTVPNMWADVATFPTYPLNYASGVIRITSAWAGGSNTPLFNNFYFYYDWDVTIFPRESIVWSNSATTKSINGLNTGLYSVDISDSYGCSNSVSSTTINEPTQLVLSTTPVNSSCQTCSDGAITSFVIGGTLPYTYDWSNSVTTQSISSLSSGIYSLTVTDANGCNSIENNIVVALEGQFGTDIDGGAAGDQFGYSVSMNSSGNQLAAGAPFNDGNGADAGEIEVYGNFGSDWNQFGSSIQGEAAGDQFGSSVSFNGFLVAAGAPMNDGNGNNAGHVRVYEDQEGSWAQLGADIDGESLGDESGTAISINENGDRIVIGAPMNDGNGINSGHVRVYEFTWPNWNQLGADMDGEAAGDQSGTSVGINANGDRIVVGAPGNDGSGTDAGHIRVYEWNGTAWIQLGADIDGEAAGDSFGTTVSINSAGNRIIIGAPRNNGNGSTSGQARIYEWDGIVWNQLGNDIDGEVAGDRFGSSVSMNDLGDRVIVGARANDGAANNAGHARVFQWTGLAWSQVEQDFDGKAISDNSGWAVTMNGLGERFAIGAPLNDDNGADAGHVRAFELSPTPIIDGLVSGLSNLSGAGNALTFDGLNDYVDLGAVPSFPMGSTARTVEAWIKSRSSATGNDEIVAYGTLSDRFSLRLNTAGRLSIDQSGSQIVYNSVLRDDQWHHVAVTYPAGQPLSAARAFVDGIEETVFSSVSPTQILNTISDDGSIGSGLEGTAQFFSGEIDEVRIWSNELTPIEIKEWMSKKINSSHPSFANLEAYYQFDQFSSNILVDLTENNDGTLTNMNTVTSWNLSGAPIGDESLCEYPAIPLRDTLPNGNIIIVENFQGSPDGVQLYQVLDTAQFSSFPPEAAFVDTLSYFGVKIFNGTSYDVKIDYTSNPYFNGDPFEEIIRVFRRDNGADGSWESATGFFSVDTDNNIICINGQTGTEFVVGFSVGTYPEEPGSGYTLQFDGGSDISIPNSPEITNINNYTFTTWLRLDNTSLNPIFSKYFGGDLDFEFYCTNSALVIVHNFNNGGVNDIVSAPVLPINEWIHLAIVHNTGNVEVFVNGVSTFTSSIELPQQNTYDLIFGSSAVLPSQLNGQLDEARLWNVPLSQNEIRSWMCKKLNSTHPNLANLVAYYRFDENQGSSLLDLANGNDGTLNGGFNAASWQESGASLGDESINTYGGTSLLDTLSNGNEITLDNLQGSPDGIHLYVVNDTTSNSTFPVTTFNEETETYFGVHMVGGTSYDVTIDYTDNTDIEARTIEPQVRGLKRDDNADGTWEFTSGNFSTNTSTNRISVLNQSGTEYTTGFTNTVYPEEPGSGYAFQFDGVNDRVDLGVYNPTDTFTIEAWIKPDAGTSSIKTIAGNKVSGLGTIGYLLYINSFSSSDRRLIFETQNQSIVSPVNTIIEDEWQHVAIVVQGNFGRLYHNGESVGTGVVNLVPSFGQTLKIGAAADPAFFWDGEIDEVRLWSDNLNQGTLRQYANQKVNANHPSFTNLELYYRADESTGTTVEDLMGNANGTYIDPDAAYTWTRSGAPLGDTSTFAAPPSPINMILDNGLEVSVLDFENPGDQISIYKVEDTALISTTPPQIASLDDRSYFGVKMTNGGSYNVVINYTNNPDFASAVIERRIRVMRRESGADTGWEQATSRIFLDIDANTITIPGQTGTEFVLGFFNNTYPDRIGSGSALNFDGNPEHIIVEASPSIATLSDYTYSAWSYLDNTGLSSFFTKAGVGPLNIDIEIYHGVSGLVIIHNNSNGGTYQQRITGLDLPVGEWFHLAVSYTSPNLDVYLNGVLEYTAVTVAPLTINNGFTLARSRQLSTGYYMGELDEVRVWNTGLDSTQIREWMCRKLTSDHDSINSLIAYYRFDEAQGDTLYDLALGNNGVLQNMEAADWQLSGAALGDSSIFSYPSGPLTYVFPNNDSISITNGEQFYVVRDTANNMTIPNGLDSLIAPPYFGIFTTDPTIQNDIFVSYANRGIVNDHEINLAKRSDNTDPAWQQFNLSARQTAPASNIFAAFDQDGRGEYMFAIGANNALDFDGTDDFLEATHNDALNLVDTFTISFWLKANNPTIGDGTIIQKGENYTLSFNDTDDRIRIGANNFTGVNPNTVSDILIPDTDWHFYAYSYDGQTIKGYRDDTEVLNNSAIFSLLPTTQLLRIGRNFVGDYAEMQLDEVRIWRRTLCQDEILAYKDCENPFDTDSLSLYYDFNFGIAADTNFLTDSIFDRSIHGINAGLNNFTKDGFTSNFIEGPESINDSCGAIAIGSPIMATVIGADASCSNFSDGTATASATGGSGIYVYEWFDGSSNATKTGLPAGTYSVIVSDQCGAQPDTVSVNISAPAAVSVSIDQGATASFCAGDSVNLTTPAQAGFNFRWLRNDNIWDTLGTSGFTNGSSTEIDLEIYNGELYVAYVDATNSDRLAVRRFDGSNWNNVGPANLPTVTVISEFDMTISPSGEIFVAYSDPANTNRPRVLRFDGTNWVQVGTTTATGLTTSYALGHDGSEPFLFYYDGGSGGGTVERYNGSSWQTVGSAAFVAGFVAETDIAFNNGNVYVSYRDGGNSNRISVSEWNGSSWNLVGPAGFSVGAALQTNIELYNDTLYAAYRDNGVANRGVVRRFDGTNWVNVGTPGFTLANIQNFQLKFQLGVPIVSYISLSGSPSVMSYNRNSDSWNFVGPQDFYPNLSSGLNIEVDDFNIYAVLADDVFSDQITAFQYGLDSIGVGTSIFAKDSGEFILYGVSGIGCPAFDTINIIENPSILLTMVLDSNVSCNGGMDASANIQVDAGTSPFTFLWNNADTDSILDNVAAGTYTVTVTAANGCTSIDSITIIEPAVALSGSVATTDVLCEGESTGVASAIAFGGTPPYTYLWNTTSTAQNLINVAAGTYTVTITDANNCVFTTSGTITEPTELGGTIAPPTNVDCNGNMNGSATFTPTGGVPPYTFLWSDPGSTTTASVSGLAAGIYTVTVTDANGCTDTETVTIAEPPVFGMSINVDSNVTCFGGNDGGLSAIPSGGVPPYTYLWSNSATTISITGLTSGTYFLTVTDANGCINAGTSNVVSEPAEILVTIRDTACAEFYWESNSTIYTASGSYNDTLVSASGCDSIVTLDLIIDPLPTVSIDQGATLTICADETTTLSAAGTGSAYQWYNLDSANWNYLGLQGFSANDATTLDLVFNQGTPYLAYRDLTNNGITVQSYDGAAWGTVGSVAFTGPADFPTLVFEENEAYVAFKDVGSVGAGLSVMTFSAGSWSYLGPRDFTPTAADLTDMEIINGEPYVVFRDGGAFLTSVMKYDTANAAWVMVGPAGISLGASTNQRIAEHNNVPYIAYSDGANANRISVKRFDGTNWIDVGPASGIPNTNASFDFKFSQNGVPHLVFEDVSQSNRASVIFWNGSAWVNLGTAGFSPNSIDFANISFDGNTPYIGYYDLTLSNSTVRRYNTSTLIWELVGTAGFTGTGAWQSLAVDNGVPYLGLRDNTVAGRTSVLGFISPILASGTTLNIDTTGRYVIEAISTEGCIGMDTIVVTESSPILANLAIDNAVSCNGGTDGQITASPSGGTAPYTYLWSNAATTTTISGLSAATYVVTITDFNSCTSVDSLTLTEPSAISTSSEVLNAINQIGANIDGLAVFQNLGISTSINESGSIVAVGSNSILNFDGETAIYEWNGSNWVQLGATINAEAANDGEGFRIDLNDQGNRIAIGAFLNDGNGADAGQVRVFEWNGTAWIQLGSDIDGENAGDRFGSSLELNSSGDRLIAGAENNDGSASDAGHARVFEWNGTAWIQLGSSIEGDAANDNAGSDVSINGAGDIVSVGLKLSDVNGLNSGNTKVYQWNGTNWTQLGADIAGESAGDLSGSSLSLNKDGDRILIGASLNSGVAPVAGHARVFDWNGTAWNQLGVDLDGLAAGDLFGFDVQLNYTGDIALIGAVGSDFTNTNGGSIFAYKWDGSNWNSFGESIGGNSSDSLGTSIDLNGAGDIVVVGSLGFDGGSFDFGRAQIFNYQIESCLDYTWASNSQTYTISGTYFDTLTSVLGCDSVIKLNLEILENALDTLVEVACNNFTWVNTSVNYTTSGFYHDTLTAANGCDSIITLNLTINPSPSVSILEGDSAFFCFGDSVQLSTTFQAGVNYQWFKETNDWSFTGARGFTPGNASSPDMIINNDTLYVSFQDQANGGGISVMKYNGVDWEYVGSPSISGGAGLRQSLISNQDTLYIAFTDILNGGTSVMKFNGTNWVFVGGSPAFAAFSRQDLVAYQDTLYVSYSDGGFGDRSSVRKYDGSNWVYVGGAGFSSGVSTWNKLTIYQDTLYLAFSDDVNGDRVSVMKFDGSSWLSVGLAGFSAGAATNISFISNNNGLFVGYRDQGNGDAATVMTHDGSSWVNVGSAGFSPGSVSEVDILFHQDTLFAAFQDIANSAGNTIMKFDGSSWSILGTPNISNGGADGASLVSNSSTLFSAFSDPNGRMSVKSYRDSLISLGTTAFAKSEDSYILRGVSSLGCFSDDTITVIELDTLIASITIDNIVSCNGFADGVVTASAIGGRLPYTYLWDNSATTASISGLIAGTYTVTVTDNIGCTDVTNIIVTEPPLLAVTPLPPLNETCSGANDGQAGVGVLGGTPPYTYLWSNTATTVSINTLSFGTYTVTVSDFNGCQEIDSVTIIVDDLIPPTAIAQDITIFLDVNGAYTLDSNEVDNGSADNCLIGAYEIIGQRTYSCADVGGLTPVQLAVFDTNGNSDTSSTVNISVLDNISPTAYAFDTLQLYLDASGQATINTIDIDSASTDNCPGFTLSLDSTNFDCFELGFNTINLFIEDASGNRDSATTIVNVLDTIAPIVVTNDIIVYLDSNCRDTVNVSRIRTSFIERCTFTLNRVNTIYDDSNIGIFQDTLITTDLSGNADTSIYNVDVRDTIRPTATAIDTLRIYLNTSGTASILPADIDNGSRDNCGAIANWGLDSSNFDCSEIGNNTITYFVEDPSGNRDSVNAIVVVLDSILPVFDAYADITVNNDSGRCDAIVSYVLPTFTDNCPSATITLEAGGIASGLVFPLGITTNTYIVTDNVGNTDTLSFNITVVDNESAVISGMPTDFTVNNDAGQCGAIVNWIAPTASDNCVVDSLVSNASPNDFFPVGDTTITYIAYEPNGLNDTTSFIITVVDTQSAVISGTPTNFSVNNGAGQCGAIVTWVAPTASDNCVVDSLVSNASPNDFFPVGDTTITYIAYEPNGLNDTTSFIITVVDTQSAVISGTPATISVDNDRDSCGAFVTWIEPTASDNCAVDSLVSNFAPNNYFPIGSTTVEYIAYEANGLNDTTIFIVLVTDTQSAVISGTPATISVDNDTDSCGAFVTWMEPTASDNCVVDSLVSNFAPNNYFPIGSTTVEYIAYEPNGLNDTTSFIVLVTDTQSAVISGTPTSFSANNGIGQCGATVNWVAPTASDNCVVDSLVSNASPNDFFPVGDTTITYIAYEPNGLNDTTSFVITVVDNELPIVITTDTTIFLDSFGEARIDTSFIDNGSTDNCRISRRVLSKTVFDCGDVGRDTISFVVTDVNGNIDSATAVVTVIDRVLPTVITQDITVQLDVNGLATITADDINNGTADSCGIQSLTIDINSFDCSDVGRPVTVTLTAIDVNGNTDSSTAIITVVDLLIPTTANAGSRQVICADNTSLGANTPIIGNGQWNVISGTGSFDNISDPNTQVTGLSIGINTFEWHITTTACNDSRDTVTIQRDENPAQADAGPDQLVCDFTNTTLNAVTPNIGNGLWSLALGSGTISNPANSRSSASALGIGRNTLVWTVTNGVCPSSSDEMILSVSNTPIIDAGPDLNIFRVDGAQLNVVSTPTEGVSYQWSPSFDIVTSSAIANPLARPEITTEFIVTVTDSLGCTASDSVIVTVEGSLIIPTAFTPNNDGFNDSWEIKNLDGYAGHKVVLFNGFGVKLFETSNYEPWDGRFNGEDLPVGSYYFVIELETFNGDNTVETGIVSIIK